MNVLIAVPSLRLPGGVANYYRTLRKHLGADKVYFEIGSRPGETGFVATIGRLLADSWRFHRELARGGWDLVHINPSMVRRAVVRDGVLLLIARMHRKPVLVFFRGWDPGFAEWIRSRRLRLFRSVYGRAAGFVVLAEEFRAALTDMGLAAPVFMATTVVDDEFFVHAPAATTARDPGACNVLYLSRLDLGKGLDVAVEAFALAQARRPRMTLTVAGDGPQRRAAEDLVRKLALGGVRFVGHIHGAAKLRLLREADIYLFPTSYAEGMPNSLLEAMACGLPVITRPVGGLRDFFEDGRMGFITESRDPVAFAALLERLASEPDLRASIGRYNRDYAGQHFAASVVSARLTAIYEQVARQAAAR